MIISLIQTIDRHLTQTSSTLNVLHDLTKYPQDCNNKGQMYFPADEKSDLLPSLKFSIQREVLIFPEKLSRRVIWTTVGTEGQPSLGGCTNRYTHMALPSSSKSSLHALQALGFGHCCLPYLNTFVPALEKNI